VVHKIEPSAAASSWDLRVNGPATGTAVLTGDIASTGASSRSSPARTRSTSTSAADARYTTNYTCTVNSQPLVSGQGRDDRRNRNRRYAD
jgi:hypothetical protein